MLLGRRGKKIYQLVGLRNYILNNTDGRTFSFTPGARTRISVPLCKCVTCLHSCLSTFQGLQHSRLFQLVAFHSLLYSKAAVIANPALRQKKKKVAFHIHIHWIFFVEVSKQSKGKKLRPAQRFGRRGPRQASCLPAIRHKHKYRHNLVSHHRAWYVN